MFTGIIEEIGKVERIQKDTCNCKLSIKASKILEDIQSMVSALQLLVSLDNLLQLM